MIYRDQEIDISKTNYNERVAMLPLQDGSIISIPEQDATAEELQIINTIKADVASRPIEEPPAIQTQPTSEQKLRADIDYLSAMMGIEL